jgi:hypothetical protein
LGSAAVEERILKAIEDFTHDMPQTDDIMTCLDSFNQS